MGRFGFAMSRYQAGFTPEIPLSAPCAGCEGPTNGRRTLILRQYLAKQPQGEKRHPFLLWRLPCIARAEDEGGRYGSALRFPQVVSGDCYSILPPSRRRKVRTAQRRREVFGGNTMFTSGMPTLKARNTPSLWRRLPMFS